MASYWTQREQLILEDRALRVDAVRVQNLSDVEKKADQVVRTIRACEATSVWGAGAKSILDYSPGDSSPNLFPGMAFLTGVSNLPISIYLMLTHANEARETVVQTKLFQILSKVGRRDSQCHHASVFDHPVKDAERCPAPRTSRRYRQCVRLA